MLDFRDLLDGVDVTKNTPSDEDVGGDANATGETEVFGFWFLSFSTDGEYRVVLRWTRKTKR